MELRRLKLQNFRQHADTDLTFGLGLTAIIGPNGAGKSTLLEAIAWAFYGAQAHRGTRDFLRWNRAPARARVTAEVEFRLGAHVYRVVRSLSTAELFQDGGASPIANSPKEVTARIERLLGMSRPEFFQTYFTGQKELTAFQSMGPADRARFLSRVLGYEKLKLTQDRLREGRSILKGELAGLESTLGDPEVVAKELTTATERLRKAEAALAGAEAARKNATEQRSALEPPWRQMIERREAVGAMESDRRAAVQHVDEARREHERLDRELAEALDAQARLRELEPALADVAPLREELDRLEHEARGAARRLDLTGERRTVQESAVAFAARLTEAPDATPVLAAAREARGTRQAELTALRDAWQADRAEAAAQRRSLLDQYRDADQERKRIQTAGADGKCPTCRRPLGQEYAGVLATLTRQLEDIELNGKFFAKRVKQLEAEPEAVRDARQRAEAAEQALAAATATAHDHDEWHREHRRLAERLATLDAELAALPDRYDADRHDAVRALLRAKEPQRTEAARLGALATRAERLVHEAEAAEKGLTEREQRARDLDAAIAGVGFRQEQFDAAKVAFEAADQLMRQSEVAVAVSAGDRKAASEAAAAAERRRAEWATRAERRAVLRTELAVHDELDRALGDLRTDLNAQLRPELADRASRFLGDLTDGRYDAVDIDDQYNVLVLEGSEVQPVISGGEEDVVHLALRLSIAQMVSDRAGQPLSLLVLDEIFGSLDEGRRQHVVALLRGLGDRFPQVVLITHIESVRDAVDRVLRVALDPERGAAVVTDESGVQDVAA